MPYFNITIGENYSNNISALKNTLKLKFLDVRNYVITFHIKIPTAEILNNEDNIIIESEYGNVAHLLVALEKEHDNFIFGTIDKESLLLIRWMVVSAGEAIEDNSQ